MTQPVQTKLLEIYKLPAGFADRLTERREGAHRLFVSLLTGLFVVLAASLRFGTAGVNPNAVIVCGVAGLRLSVA